MTWCSSRVPAAVARVAAVCKHGSPWSLRGNAGELLRRAAIPPKDLGARRCRAGAGYRKHQPANRQARVRAANGQRRRRCGCPHALASPVANVGRDSGSPREHRLSRGPGRGGGSGCEKSPSAQVSKASHNHSNQLILARPVEEVDLQKAALMSLGPNQAEPCNLSRQCLQHLHHVLRPT